MNKLERLLKYLDGGKILKLQNGGYTPADVDELLRLQNEEGLTSDLALAEIKRQKFEGSYESLEVLASEDYQSQEELKAEANLEQPYPTKSKKSKFKLTSALKTLMLGTAASAGVGIINGVDQALMGDKNFSASSKAIDSAVSGVSSKLISSGNPFAIGAGVALEGLNFLTKLGGKTVQGYDVSIENSGYSLDMLHLQSEAGRFWENMNGKLARRNEKARMALAALDVSSDEKYEQEARTNSVTNVLLLNRIALSGGIDAGILGN